MGNKQNSTPSALRITQTFNPGKISDIKINGHIDVSIHDGYKESKIILKGHRKDLANLKYTVHNETFDANLGKGYPQHGNVSIEIRTTRINSFEYHGRGQITGKKLHSMTSLIIENDGLTTLGEYLPVKYLELSGEGFYDLTGLESPGMRAKLKNSARVYIRGMVNLSHLELTDDSWINLYWVKSHTLHVRGRDNAFIQLAGIANQLHVDLCQDAHFAGKHLRAKSTFVKTHDTSLAEISTTIKQHTLAADNSDIYYYELPPMQTDFMIFNGSTLDLRDIREMNEPAHGQSSGRPGKTHKKPKPKPKTKPKKESFYVDKDKVYAAPVSLRRSHLAIQVGGYLAHQGHEQHINIAGLIGNQFDVNVTRHVDGNFLFGLNYYVDAHTLYSAKVSYGFNIFYLPKAGVSGTIVQEDLFTNLAYDYRVTHYPLYATARAQQGLSNEKMNLTMDLGMGVNYMSTNDYNDYSLDNGITIPDRMFSGKTKPTFSATAGIGLEIAQFIGEIPLECGYRFFYLGTGQLNKTSEELVNTLHTGTALANAVMCSLRFF